MESKSTVLTPDSQPSTDDCVPPVWIEVDLQVIQQNFRQIRRFVSPHVKVLTVVKANAYGHGLLPVARALMEAGTDHLAVANVVEAVALRRAGVSAKLLVLGQLLPEEAPLVVRHGLIQAIGDFGAAKALSREALLQEKLVSIHLKVDTGMGRYGVWHEEAVSLFRRLVELPGLVHEGIFTHLSSAGQNAPATEEQLEGFSQLIQRLEKARLPVGIRHAANSVGMLRFPLSHWDLVRTGLLVYGVSPVKDSQPIEIHPALSLKSRVRFLKTLQPGQAVSYGGTWKAEKRSLIATVPVGYAHGYTRALSNKAQLLVRGRRAPVVGRVTMEDLMCDVTDIPGAQIGDEVVLIGRQGGEQVTAEELARHARTIPYEILVGLSPSIPRRYL
ncbi:MAG: alanine racemase [Candidatus Omnitrophota bacterium]|nr:alanine racemase [Candidatus Omnitrophota bacterium]